MTKLEKEILEWIDSEDPQYGLGKFISKLKVSDRELTDIGFFTGFESHEPIPELLELGTTNITGPYITAEVMGEGADSLIHIENGNIEYLEVYSIGDGNANDIISYQLQSWG